MYMNIIKKLLYKIIFVLSLFTIISGIYSCSKSTQNAKNDISISEDGVYTSKEEVAKYISVYKKLPSNFITKSEARKLGWQVGSNNDLSKVAKGKSIGGDEFKNLERLLPVVDGRKYYECDIDYVSGKRNAKRIVYAIDDDDDEHTVHIYYTEDHYNSFIEIIAD